MNLRERDAMWMGMAINLARKGKGRTAPNPCVGAVIVKNEKIIGQGWHKKAGWPHAEVVALGSCKTSPKGATLYVTLEPCNHHGKTGPCAVAITGAGIKKVVIGSRDTSPKKGSRGIGRLRRGGVKVRTGVLKKECDSLITDFIKHSSTGMPLVTLKTAITLDGKISTETGDSRWISSELSRRLVHRMRNEMDAVMIGAGTAVEDDPMLTCRFGRSRRDPLRVIVDGDLKIPITSKIIGSARSVPTLIATTRKAKISRIEETKKRGANVMVSPGGGGKVNLGWLMSELGKRNVMSVLLEGAGGLAGSAVDAGIVDRVMFFIAPKIVGGSRSAITGFAVKKMAEALEVKNVVINQIGPDLLIEGDIIK